MDHQIPEPAKSYPLTYQVPDKTNQEGQPLEGRCMIRVWYHGATTIVVCTDDPTGTVFHNFNAETIANIVWKNEGQPDSFVYVEQWIDQRLPPHYVCFTQQHGRLVDRNQGAIVEPNSFIGRILAADYLTP